MPSSSRLALRIIAIVVAASLASACSPDPCTTPLDCFTGESCVAGVCLPPEEVPEDAGEDADTAPAEDVSDDADDAPPVEDAGEDAEDGGADADEPDTAPPPGPTFVAISAGAFHACALTSEKRVVCWGDGTAGQLNVPAEPFRSVHAGGKYTCGILESGEARCWGDESTGLQPPADMRFEQLAAGATHICGISNNVPSCYGSTGDETNIPNGVTVVGDIAAGDGYTCALLITGEVRCWGANLVANQAPDASLQFDALYAGGLFACVLDGDDLPTCWGAVAAGATNAPDQILVKVALGRLHGCAIREDATVICWGDDQAGRTNAPPGEFEALAAGENFSCGLDRDGNIRCWGANDSGQTDAPTRASLNE